MDKVERERRLLQRIVAFVALIAAVVGLYGVLFGPSITGDTVSISAESHFRYLSGLLLAVGLGFLSTVPSIEEKTGRFRLLTLIVFVGGLGRLVGLLITGVPSLYMLGGLATELVATPALCLWQTRIANRYAERQGVADLTRDDTV